MARIFVLGSNSFAGSCFVDAALSQGHSVVGASRSPEPHAVMLPYKRNPRLSSFVFHQWDINDDFEALWALLADWQPEFIVDFAGQGMVAPSWEQPWQWYQTNLVAKSRLHRALAGKPWLKRYLRCSTPEVYGDVQELIRPDLPMRPSTPYAVSHAAVDMHLATFHKQFGFPVIFGRFANFYGPGQQLYRIIPKTMLCGLGGTRLQLHGGGHSVRAFIHGRDVAGAFLRLLEAGQTGETYHFSTDEYLSIRELVRRIAGKMSLDFDALVEVVADRPGKDAAYKMDFSKSVEELGWRPEIDLEHGLDDCLAWARETWAVTKDMNSDYIHKP